MLEAQSYDAEEVFRVCISRVRDQDLKTRLEGCITEIIQDSLDFDTKAAFAQLHTIPMKTQVNGNVSKDEME